MARKKNAFPYPSGMPTLYPLDDDQREAHHPSALVPWPAAWKVGRPDNVRWHVSSGAPRTADRSPLRAGTDERYGARNLKRAIERYLVCPLSRLVATSQVRSGDVLLVDRHPGDKGLAFLKDTEKRSSYVPFAAPNLSRLAAAEV